MLVGLMQIINSSTSSNSMYLFQGIKKSLMRNCTKAKNKLVKKDFRYDHSSIIIWYTFCCHFEAF